MPDTYALAHAHTHTHTHALRKRLNAPRGELDHLVDLVSTDEVSEGEAFELDDECRRQPPDGQLLGRLAVLLALRTVPEAYNTHCGGGSSGVTTVGDSAVDGTIQALKSGADCEEKLLLQMVSLESEQGGTKDRLQQKFD